MTSVPLSTPPSLLLRSVLHRILGGVRPFFSRVARPATVADALSHIEARSFSKALAIVQPLADAGDATAQRVLGLIYLNGYGVLPNPAEAVVWLRQAAGAGDIQAQHQLALVYALGPCAQEGRSSFGKWYTAMVLGGSALESIGADDLFPDGLTVEKDVVAAVTWARAAAEAGHSDAQNNLGVLLLHGRGADRNQTEAAAWFEKAANAGNTTAKAYLGILASSGEMPDWVRAFALVGEAAEADDTLAQTTLGYWCVTGAGNRPMDFTRGVANLALASAKGAAESQYLMGACALEGRGLPRNPWQAETWWRRASSKDYVPAMLALGKLYSSGDLGYRNHIEAAPLLKRAAEHGMYEAQLIYGRHVLIGAGAPQSLTEALGWFEMALRQRQTPEVQYEVGRALIWLSPGAQPSEEALGHLRASAAAGNTNAAQMLEALEVDENLRSSQ